MKREIVILEIHKSKRVFVSVDFEMEGRLEKPLGIGFPETDFFPLQNFFVQWDGLSLPVERWKAKPGFTYRIGNLSLPAIHHFYLGPSSLSQHRLLTRYEYQAPQMSGSKSPKGIYLEYILQTGSTWDSWIEEVIFIIRGKDFHCSRLFVLPDSYRGSCTESGEYLIRLQNIEPKMDFRFILED
ncbi:hypothetical protein [Leptospira ryugenii]|uniref:hypothetical protein n=1 Tax=Leptospira ryugenii TaxID=1917863 RepID=UPI0014354954|nr:hypothetical protein [Leptospira ryugenii]